MLSVTPKADTQN